MPRISYCFTLHPAGYRKNQKYNRHGSKNERDRRRVSQPEPPQVDPDSPVAQAFLQYKTQLDTKHDKHEALVKISRDVTIESKRIIFHLHRCIGLVSSISNNRTLNPLKLTYKPL